MLSRKRQRLLVDRKVQLALLWRVTGYWMYCLVAVMFLLVCWVFFTDRPSSSAELVRRMWSQFAPALAASFLVLPLVLIDCLRLSSRFVGPIFRLRQAMQSMSGGGSTAPLKFRDNDFWSELASDFNRLVVHLQERPSPPIVAEPLETDRTSG